MRWDEIPETIDRWALAVAAPGWDLKRAAASVYADGDVGYYVQPETGQVGVHAPQGGVDLALTKAAAARIEADPAVLSLSDLAVGPWVKVAHSASLRRLGELLNFFPGQYPGGIPNAPSPAAATLTSGLVGAGLGYGGGRLLGSLLPEGYGDQLATTGLMLGGALGAAPGAAWAGSNLSRGRSIWDPRPLDEPAGGPPRDEVGTWREGANVPPPPAPHPQAPGRLHDFIGRMRVPDESPAEFFKGAAEALAGVPLHPLLLGALTKQAGDAFGTARLRPHTDLDVDINALGQTLWAAGAPPNLAASTMGALYAAQQLPDPRSRPGWATGHQLGQLAANAAGDYARGLMAGAALNAVVGTPYHPSRFGAGALALGVVGAVIPRLFGR